MPHLCIRAGFSRRALLASLAAIAAVGLAMPAAAESSGSDWPQRPVRVIVPFSAGGNIDVMARILSNHLSETTKQQFIVENRTGGAGIVGAEAVARADPDGYTLLFAATNVFAIVPNTLKTPYDTVKDFAPISALGQSPQVLLVHTKVPAKTVKEVVAWVKSQPAKVSYAGGGGPGSASNLIMSLFMHRAELSMTGVFYRGTSQAILDVIAGHIPLTFVPISEAIAQSKNPNVRLIAVSSAERASQLPDLPTIAEAAYPGFDASSWTGIAAPGGTPKAVIDKIGAAVVSATKDPKFVAILAKHGVEPIGNGPEKFTQMIKNEIGVWGQAVKIAGVKVKK